MPAGRAPLNGSSIGPCEFGLCERQAWMRGWQYCGVPMQKGNRSHARMLCSSLPLLAVAVAYMSPAPLVVRMATSNVPDVSAPTSRASHQVTPVPTVAWRSVPSMDTSPLQSNHLRSVSCATTSFCVAVGYFFNGLTNQALVEVYSVGRWARAPASQAPPTELNVLQGVSCATTSFCVAVGYFFNGLVNRPLLEVLRGTAFVAEAPGGSLAAGSEKLYGVSCVASGVCGLVGDQAANGVWRVLEGVYTSSAWSVSPGHQGVLYAVSCASATSCMAVGDRVGLAAWQALAASYSGASWSAVTVGDTATTEANVLRGVSCPGTSYCVAAGSYWNGALWQTLVDTWDGSAWSITPTPDTPAPEDDYLYSVSCASPAYCIAAGAHVTHGLIETFDRGAWRITASPDSSTSSWDTLWGTSCAAVASCVSVGTRGIFNGTVRQTWVERSGSPGVQGYWMASSAGSVIGFGNGYFYGSADRVLEPGGAPGGQSPVIGIAKGPYALGYWLVASDGGIFSFGDAQFYGSMGGRLRSAAGIASTGS